MLVNRSRSRCTSASGIVRTLQGALDDWGAVEPRLRELDAELEVGTAPTEPFEPARALSPLPRIYEWVDGSAYLNHLLLVRKARKAPPPPRVESDPLVYQGGGGMTLAPTGAIPLVDEAFGLDFEAEVCVVLGDVPMGTRKQDAGRYVRLLMLCNDVTYRNLIPQELEKGFGFFQSKPATAFSPIALTPDELGESLREGRLFGRLSTSLNGARVGDPDAGTEMHFSFHELLEHICRTRSFTAGTVLGSGTVSNVDRSRGVSCLAEQRMHEIIDSGAAVTPFLKDGDRVRIEMMDDNGVSLFGAIDQRVSRVAT